MVPERQPAAGVHQGLNIELSRQVHRLRGRQVSGGRRVSTIRFGRFVCVFVYVVNGSSANGSVNNRGSLSIHSDVVFVAGFGVPAQEGMPSLFGDVREAPQRAAVQRK